MTRTAQNRVLLQLCVIAILLALAAPAAFAQQAPDLATIVERMSAVQHSVMAAYRPYELTRQYQIFAHDADAPRTEVVARIAYVPPGETTYGIERSTGGMGERAIRRALDHEVDLTRTPEKVEMTERNYTFTLAGATGYNGHRCWVLQTHPRREDKDLLIAKIWVDADSYRILRIMGHPQKSPSFWLKDVNLTMEYGEMGGMWMHTSTRAEADVRFSGPFTVVSRDLSLEAAPVLARARQKHTNTAAMVGAAIR